MVPKLSAVGHLVQLRYADTVLVGRHLLRHDIHGHLAEIHVCSDASSGGDTCSPQHVAYHGHGELMRGHFVCFKVVRHIHEHLVDAIHMNVFRSEVLQVSLIHLGAHVHIMRHLRRRDKIIHLPVGMCLQFDVIDGLTGKATACLVTSLVVDLPDTLHHLEQTCAASDAIRFE